jgi:hypothetical protein
MDCAAVLLFRSGHRGVRSSITRFVALCLKLFLQVLRFVILALRPVAGENFGASSSFCLRWYLWRPGMAIPTLLPLAGLQQVLAWAAEIPRIVTSVRVRTRGLM